MPFIPVLKKQRWVYFCAFKASLDYTLKHTHTHTNTTISGFQIFLKRKKNIAESNFGGIFYIT